MKRTVMLGLAAAVLAVAGTAQASWNAFVIRNGSVSNDPPIIQPNTDYVPSGVEFVISDNGQKAAWGTSDLDGHKVGDIARLAIARFDDPSRFTAGSGPAVAPYFNIWITDGNGHYAVIANEPSNPAFQPLFDDGYDLSWADIAGKTAKVFENDDKSWLPNNGVGLTFADLANFTIQAPSPLELATGWPGLGTGAPRQLGTNAAYGFNWIFGDTLSNYVSGSEGYVVAEPAANPVVETRYVVSRESLAGGAAEFSPPHGTGTNPFAYDWDSARPDAAGDGAPGYGTSSFYASVDENGATSADRYRTLRIGLQTLFGRNVTVGELAKLTYYTKKPAAQTEIDWRLTIYTTAMGDADDSATWYRSRIQASPPNAASLNAPANQWNQWSTDAGTNQLQFYQSNRTGFSAPNMSWGEIAGGPVTRNAHTHDFSVEEIMMIDLTLGANSGGGAGESQIDGVRIELNNGQIADIDLEIAPLLQLNAVAAPLYIRPGDTITVNMNISNLQTYVAACQAMLGYESAFFGDPTDQGDPNHYFAVSPGGGDWDQLIYDSWKVGNGIPGEIDTAIGVHGGSSSGTNTDGIVAKITLTALPGVEGTTQIVFRPDLVPDPGLTKSTFLSDMSASPVWPAKVNSQTIVIDGTLPDLTCPGDMTVYCGESTDPPATGVATATDDSGSVTITYSDDVSGLTGCNATGTIVRTWTAVDLAGNVSTCQQTITVVDNTDPVMTACPANITQDTDAGQCDAVVSYTAPTATDTCYSEGFEDPAIMAGAYPAAPSVNWNEYNSLLLRVVSGTDGIVSKDGLAHGVIDSTVLPAPPDDNTGLFSRLRGYSSDFGHGWSASLDVYIDLNDPAVAAKTYGWDLSVAASNTSGGHRRDFIFHAAADDTAAPGHVLIAGSNNSNFQKRNDLDTLNHYEIATSGWYTFEWVFRDGGAGVLAVDLNLRDANGTLLWTETRSNPTDIIGSTVGGNRYMWFTFLAVDKLAIDNTRLIRNVPVTCSIPSNSAFSKGTTTVVCTATDACGNEAQCSFDVTIEDNGAPTVSIDSAAQDTQELLGTSAVAVQGAVEITVSAADNCSLAGPPVVVVTDANNVPTDVTSTAVPGSGTWTYTYAITPATANGTATIAVTATDLDGNNAVDSDTFVINKNQITGQIQLQGFVGGTREVTFVATGASTKTWTLPLTFTGDTASYTLTGVPDGVTGLSAKTAWSLRRKLACTPDGDGQAVVDFTGAAQVLGGDLNDTNSVNVLDYSLLKTNWGGGTVGDITGDGGTNISDYSIMQANWFQVGDPQ